MPLSYEVFCVWLQGSQIEQEQKPTLSRAVTYAFLSCMHIWPSNAYQNIVRKYVNTYPDVPSLFVQTKIEKKLHIFKYRYQCYFDSLFIAKLFDPDCFHPDKWLPFVIANFHSLRKNTWPTRFFWIRLFQYLTAFSKVIFDREVRFMIVNTLRYHVSLGHILLQYFVELDLYPDRTVRFGMKLLSLASDEFVLDPVEFEKMFIFLFRFAPDPQSMSESLHDLLTSARPNLMRGFQKFCQSHPEYTFPRQLL
jgi:hypothetical protein